ncbi:mannose-6-phosphate isomerase, class I [Gordonia sp. (in: high G+C Gram-positive bacteria)]|uniref:mannose-6-phosphate isomerase, class I n=1 Tax=Gordonia sp. (in: high G+C Gram-positive bacteria) TaxID=84139 RepID=UPI0019C4660C|nr:mannose-6-phosphate isomerase, class I [Gordonia sp. (in: high G+C Gram-positive bacteria)]MBD0023145.1 mannose-6-phosphate isomerase, class I [Gordonia sp. (in: high G+C Gram-positive bacteria)]
MELLEGVVRPYAWGSRTAIASLQCRPTPSAHPEAELWFGAHPAAPAQCVRDTAVEQNSSDSNLLSVIREDPAHELGAAVLGRFGERLPFLLKILAAEEPLSLQAHPTLAQADEGFARENALGLALDAPERNYRDPWHKPELVVAVTQFDALAGFRPPTRTVELFRELQVPALDPYLGLLAGQADRDGLRALFTTWLTLPDKAITTLVTAVLEGAVAVLESGADTFTDELRTLLELGEMYPGDPGVLASLLLNRVRLNPGESLYLPAGSLHAYLHGTAVEIMANSDNVLRGGLTPKHIDVPELLRVLDFTPTSDDELLPTVRTLGAERIYLTPAAEFRLSRIELDGTGLLLSQSISFDMPGPQMLAVLGGTIEVRAATGDTVSVAAGSALWLADGDPDVVVRASSSRATFVRVLVPVSQVAAPGQVPAVPGSAGAGPDAPE